MTRRRFFAPREAFSAAGVTLGAEEARHLRDVLRLRPGDEAFVFDGEGREYSCVVREVGRGAVTLDVRERVEPLRPESPLDLALCLALLKGEKFDLVVQKATELGVTRIVPVLTRRADVRLRDGGDTSRGARWRRLALEAAKQSGRARIPTVADPVAVAALLADEEHAAGARLMFAERGGRGLIEIAGEFGARPGRAAALVGPEGGWEDEEIARAREAGWAVVTLGGRTLRAETAAVAVSALLQHLFGDLV